MGLFDRFRRRPSFEPWPRRRHEPGGGEAHFEFYCFGHDNSDASLDLPAEGHHASTLPPGVEVQTEPFTPGTPAFEHLGFYRDALAERFPDLDVARIDTVHMIVGDVPDPDSLTYLQAAWAAVRWHLRHGSAVVRDVRAERWHTRDGVLATDPRDPTLACGWRVMVEQEQTPGYGHLLYTHGMAKFGRPDIITAVPASVVDEATEMVQAIAGGMVEGKRIPSLPHTTAPGATFEAYGAGVNAPERDFNNDQVVFLRLDR